MRDICIVATALILVGCAASPSLSSAQYTVVNVVGPNDYSVAGHHYDGEAIGPALIAATPDDGVHVVVLRGARTVEQLLKVMPTDPSIARENVCYFWQEVTGELKSFTMQRENEPMIGSSNCPSGDDVVRNVGVYKPEATDNQ